ncbi:MAG TPA: hypothetical protein VEZ20_05665 [Allosphingosinicella sp.]|nr:hypothetical protein [Allosphingosinicella sp.]
MSDTRTQTTGTGAEHDKGNGRQKSRAAEAYESTRARTTESFSGVRERASRATETAGRQISANPMAAVAGGLAVGALLGALLPRTDRETQLLGGVGGKINDAAREAARTAAEAGRQQVEEISETAATRVGEAVIGAVTSAASGSSSDGGSNSGGGNSGGGNS